MHGVELYWFIMPYAHMKASCRAGRISSPSSPSARSSALPTSASPRSASLFPTRDPRLVECLTITNYMSDDIASTPDQDLLAHRSRGGLCRFRGRSAVYSSRMTHDYPDYDQRRAPARGYEMLAQASARTDEQGRLTTADWVDQDKGSSASRSTKR